MDSRLRKALYERSQGYCDVCGLPLLAGDMAAHHRRMRSQGGEDRIHNLLALHHRCHNLATTSVHLNVKDARKYGWIVPSGLSPEATPVLLHRRKAVVLDADGGIRPVSYCFDCQSEHCDTP